VGESLKIDFEKSGGVVPVVTQDADSGEVLMLAYMNEEALRETLRTGRACYWSRTRRKLWRKGEESGNHQDVRGVFVDCDRDTILLQVHQHGGAACHEGYRTCFYRRNAGESWEVVGERIFNPEDVYRKPSRSESR
jgi:phosphoribosyl-AMP cyclohydrolase